MFSSCFYSLEWNEISSGVMTLARSFNLTFDENRLEYKIIERVANEKCEEERKKKHNFFKNILIIEGDVTGHQFLFPYSLK